MEPRQHSWLSVPTEFKTDAKRFLQGKVIKASREVQFHGTFHDLRHASWAAYRCGAISMDEREADDTLNRLANKGKHETTPLQLSWARRLVGTTTSSFRKPWADTIDDDVGHDAQPGSAWADSINDHVGSSSGQGAASLPIGDNAENWMSSDRAEDLEESMHAKSIGSCNGNLSTSGLALVASGRSLDAELEENMPTDLDSILTASGGAPPSGVSFLKEQKGDMEYHDDASFGHPQKFYIPLSLEAANKELREKITSLEIHNVSLSNLVLELQYTVASLHCQQHSLGTAFQPLPLPQQYGLSQFIPMDTLEMDASLGGPLPLPAVGHSASLQAPAEESAELMAKKGVEELREEMYRSFQFQRMEQHRLDDGLVALTKRVVDLEEAGHIDARVDSILENVKVKAKFHEMCSDIQTLRDEFRSEWHSCLQAIRETFQSRLERLEANGPFDDWFDKRLRSHLYDERLLEHTRAIQDIRSKVQEAACDYLHSNSGSELLLRIKRLQTQIDQLQSSADSGLFTRIESGQYGKAVPAIPEETAAKEEKLEIAIVNPPVAPSPCSLECGPLPQPGHVRDLQALFERLQSSHVRNSEIGCVPIVDMGEYVSNSIWKDPKVNELGCGVVADVQASLSANSGYNPNIEVDDNESENSSASDSCDSKHFARDLRQAGYDPDGEAFHMSGDEELEYEEYLRNFVPSDEPWSS